MSGWTGVRYLHDWTDIAKSFDIATGYFEIGSLLKLDGRWQQLDKIRILMGAEVTHRTRAAFLKLTKERELVPQSFEHGGSARTGRDTGSCLMCESMSVDATTRSAA